MSTPLKTKPSLLFTKLISDINAVKQQRKADEERFQANKTGANVYFLYEKFRNAFEYQEQHLFLRSAIARFLNRKLRFSKKRQNLAQALITELIKTRYIANDSVPLETIELINGLIRDYLELYNQSLKVSKDSEESDALSDYTIEIMSYDIERLLVPHPIDELFVNFTYADMRARIDTAIFDNFNEQNFHIALFANVHRQLRKSNMAIIRYYLFYQRFSDWRKDNHSIAKTAKDFYSFNTEAEHFSTNKFAAKVAKIVRHHVAPYRVLYELAREDIELTKLIEDREALDDKLRLICERTYTRQKTQLRGGIIRSIIFIFLTKVLLALIVEVPYEIIIAGHMQWLPLIINLSFPSLYMLAIGLTIKVPGEENTKRLLHDIHKIVYSQPTFYKLRTKPKPSTLGKVFSILYGITFVITFLLLIKLLLWLRFSWVGGAFFFIFLSTVSFFGLRISQSTKELQVIDEKKGFIGALIDFLYTPFVRIGQWLSDKYSRINFFNYALDIFFELPLKSVLSIFEQWVGFIRAKRDDLL